MNEASLQGLGRPADQQGRGHHRKGVKATKTCPSDTDTANPQAGSAPGRGLCAVGLMLLVTGCTLDDANFSQYPGFDAYLSAFPPADEPASERERHLLKAFRPRFYVAADETGPISFYDDYIAEGRLYDAAGELVATDVDRALLNEYRDDPQALFVHEPVSEGGTPVVAARASTSVLRLPGMEAPETAVFLHYHLVFRHSGIAAGITGWQRAALDLIGDADDWHQLDHYAAVTLALVPEPGVAVDKAGPEELIPFAATMQQHNYMRAYALVGGTVGGDHPGRMVMDANHRIAVDVAEASHALFPHARERRRHRAVRFLDADSAEYLVSGHSRPLISGDDVTDPAREVDYALQFLPPSDAFYTFQGWLGERRRLPGRDSPPGALYNTLPPLQPERVQMSVFFWFEGAADYPRDLAGLELHTWRPPREESLAPFQHRLVRALPCRDDWTLPCARDL